MTLSESSCTDFLWGKLGVDGAYPLLAHMIDTSAFFSALWDCWFSQTLKNSFLNSQLEIHVDSHYSFLAGLHDLGKAEPIFQAQSLSHKNTVIPNKSKIEALGEPGSEFLTSLKRYPARSALRRSLRHEAISKEALNSLGFPKLFSEAVGGHHGRYLSETLDKRSCDNDIFEEHLKFIDKGPWQEEQTILIENLKQAVNPDDLKNTFPIAEEQLLGPLVPILTGAICLADWLSSDEKFWRNSNLTLLSSPREFYLAQKDRAIRQIEDKLGLPVKTSGSFQDLFPYITSKRPIQETIELKGEATGLTIIAVPMGEGKTEAALLLHAKKQDGEGLIFGLPTMATADAMLDRILKFYEQFEGKAHLAHGKSILNAFYSENSKDTLTDDVALGLTSSSWFSGPHRALAAPVTVATCDQILAAIIKHKYSPVRLVSLVNKHIILDEVHTYDAYQAELLKSLLGWLGYHKVRVTLLTATLPQKSEKGYVEAYKRGWDKWNKKLKTEIKEVSFYPRVTFVNEAISSDPILSSRNFDLKLQYHYLQNFEKETWPIIRDKVAANPLSKVGVIVNTVDRAINLAEEAEAAGINPILLHSRMTFSQREKAFQRIMLQTGKGSKEGSVLVIATQIAEASLDCDFDILITDLAPAPSLLQRAGRQWRHSSPSSDGWFHPEEREAGRPSTTQTMDILVHVDAENKWKPSSRFPYQAIAMRKTWQAEDALALGKRALLRIPEDLQAMVDASEVSWEEVASNLEPEEQKELIESLGKDAASKNLAKMVTVQAETVSKSWSNFLDPRRELSSCDALGSMTSGTIWKAEAVTRLADQASEQLLILDPEEISPYTFHGDLEEVKNLRATAGLKDLLGKVIPVSGRVALDVEKLKVSNFAEEKVHPLIKGLSPVYIDSLKGKYNLTHLGLQKIKENNE